MSRYIAILVALFAVVLAVLFTFANAYTLCSEQHTEVELTRARLYQECSALAEVTPRLTALTLRYAQEYQGLARTATLARTRLDERRSPADMARAHALLTASLNTMVTILESRARVRDTQHFLDVRQTLREKERNLDTIVTQYNHAVATYNATLRDPTARFWRDAMGFDDVEPFDPALRRSHRYEQPAATPQPTPTARSPRNH